MAVTDVRPTSEEESRKVAEESREQTWAGRTFLRELFLGNFLLDHIHPFPVVKEERPRFSSRTDLSNPAMRSAYSVAFFPELIPNFADEYADGVRPRLTVALLNGDIALVGASGEFFSNHSIRLKERARVKQLFFFGYCNGYHQYFPTIEAVAEGGYGADNKVSPVAVGAGEQMMDTALIWIYQMLKKF